MTNQTIMNWLHIDQGQIKLNSNFGLFSFKNAFKSNSFLTEKGNIWSWFLFLITNWFNHFTHVDVFHIFKTVISEEWWNFDQWKKISTLHHHPIPWWIGWIGYIRQYTSLQVIILKLKAIIEVLKSFIKIEPNFYNNNKLLLII
jgi:hypothetical protein